jgi:hypothetical protein
MITDNFKANAKDIEKLISKEFSEYFKIGNDINWDSNAFWTLQIKKILDDIGRKTYGTNVKNGREFFTAASGLMKQHEWLYDLVWYEYDTNKNKLTNIYLVAESEWKTSWNKKSYLTDLQYDFEKLLLARSPYRLMIFDGYSEEELKSYISHFNSIIDEYHHSQKNDRYMYAAWLNSNKNSEFIFDLKIVS